MKTLVFLFLCINFTLLSQTKVYRGERMNSNDLAYNITNQKVERMTSSIWEVDYLFISGNKVFGNSYKTQCLYTIKGAKIYKGDSDSVFDLIYEIDNNQLFLVSPGSLRKCIFTLNNNQIFIGDSRSSFDCIFSIEFDDTVKNSATMVFLSIAPF